MKSPIVRWLIALNILVLCGVLLAFFVQRHYQQQARQTERIMADRMVQRGLENDDATSAERAQLDVISHNVVKRRTLTDDQFSFLITQLSKANSKGVATGSHLYASLTLNSIRVPLSASQRAMLTNRLVPLLQIPDPTNSSVFTLNEMHKLEACRLLALFNIREAIPQLVPLLDDPKPQVRNDAKQALLKLGYST